ncbi:rac GTPase-activating protein 1-like [Glossina fuscipes fuscipes]
MLMNPKRKRQELEEEVTNSSNTSSRSSANCVNQLTEMLNYSSFLKGPEEQTLAATDMQKQLDQNLKQCNTLFQDLGFNSPGMLDMRTTTTNVPEFVPVETSYNHQNDPRSAIYGRPNVSQGFGKCYEGGLTLNKDLLEFYKRIVATTKVTIPQDGQGAIRAESTIETASLQARQMNALGGIEYIDEAPACTPQKSISTPATVKPITPVITPSTTGTLKRGHNLARKKFIKPEICINCQKRIRFNMDGLRCRDCPERCHINCRPHLTICCVPRTPTNKGLMSHLADYAPEVPPMIPALIVHCVHEIESRGLQEKGIYRVSGSEREIKALKERFLKNKTIPHLGNIDVHVLCGCIKDFLRSLSDPLIFMGNFL